MFIGYVPTTRSWADIGISGAPVGAQVPWLLSSNTGAPSTVTRVAADVKNPLTQGPPAFDGSGQAAIVYGESTVTTN
jgi:hypothetical protein